MDRRNWENYYVSCIRGMTTFPIRVHFVCLDGYLLLRHAVNAKRGQITTVVYPACEQFEHAAHLANKYKIIKEN